MIRPSYRQGIFAAAILAASAASAAYAGSDIVKCVDQAGHVTLTDSLCSEGNQTVLAAGSSDDSAAGSAGAAPEIPAPPRVMSIERVLVSRVPVRHDSWAGQRQTGRILARDVETLKAARLSMRVLDEASATLRHQRLASLN